VPSRDYRLDFLSAGLVIVALFLAGSFISFDPADPPSDLVYPMNVEVQNWCGRAGAYVSFEFVELLGIGVFGIVGLVLVAAIAAGLRLPIRQALCQAVGVILITLSLVTLSHWISFDNKFTTVAGLGGSIGGIIANSAEHHLSIVGSLLVLVPMLCYGIILTFGSYAFIAAATIGRGAKQSAVGASRGVSGMLQSLTFQFKRRQSEKTEDLAEETDEIEDSEEDGLEGETVEEVAEFDDEEESSEEEDDTEDELEDEDSDALKIVRTGFDQAPVPAMTYASPQVDDTASVKLPTLDILEDSEPFVMDDHDVEIRERAKLLEKTFAEFSMKVKVVQIDTGPVVTQYEIELEPGLRARKVIALSDDIAIALKASSVRIVAPIPGKNTVGIEVPNVKRAKVTLKEVMIKGSGMASTMRLPMYLGKDVKGLPMVNDLATMPHLLIAGRTGTGKSVCLNTLILSILMTRTPDQVKMLMIDPKMVELSLYKSIPHLMHPVVTDMKKAEAILAWAVEKMEERYSLLARVGVRHIDSYNSLDHQTICERLGVEIEEEKKQIPKRMPYILIFADEMADMMMTSGKEVEAHIIRLAQKSRAVGIHLILATQKPTVDVVTGLIKSNLPARIAFQVASRTDSRVVLDEMGADKLLGNGDMLFLYPGTSKITRAQGTYVSDAEVTRVVEYLSQQAKPQFSEELLKVSVAPSGDSGPTQLPNRDDMYEAAVEVVVREQRGSVSLLQRALGVGYGRAARLIDYMAEDGIVGEYNGSQAREVVVKPEQWEEFRKQRFARAG
jgi:S-DNA-T family DNA segregation ATPase FtsK/SpoIIIE